MIGRREFETIAKINARGLADAAAARHIEDRVHSGAAIWHIIARQVAAFQLLNPAFDARQFVKASGVAEAWEQSQILSLAAKDE